MAEHRVSVIIPAPVHQVYAAFSRFVDYPKLFSYVKEVTFVDEHTTNWVVDIAGRHTWTAVREDWIPDRQIGWRSTQGFRTSGRMTFQTVDPGHTQLDVTIAYDPPAGPIGTVGEVLGIGAAFESALRHDLRAFATTIEQSPSAALDPNSADYVLNLKRSPADAPAEGENHEDVPIVPGTSRSSQNAL